MINSIFHPGRNALLRTKFRGLTEAVFKTQLPFRLCLLGHLSVTHLKPKFFVLHTTGCQTGEKKHNNIALPPANNTGIGIIVQLQFQRVDFFFLTYRLTHTHTHTPPPSASRHLCLIFKWSRDHLRAIPDFFFHCSWPLPLSPPPHCHDIKVDLRQGRQKSNKSLFRQAIT